MCCNQKELYTCDSCKNVFTEYEVNTISPDCWIVLCDDCLDEALEEAKEITCN